MKPQGEPDNQHRRTYLDGIHRIVDVFRGERGKQGICWQGATVEFNHRYIHLPGGIGGLPPHAQAINVQRNRKASRASQVAAIYVQLDRDEIGQVIARFIYEYMPTGNQEQPPGTLKEKTAGIR